MAVEFICDGCGKRHARHQTEGISAAPVVRRCAEVSARAIRAIRTLGVRNTSTQSGTDAAHTGVTTMLVLKRRIGETVMIGDDVALTVLGVKGNQVRVGIAAPKSVPVHRQEIYERIQRERQTSL